MMKSPPRARPAVGFTDNRQAVLDQDLITASVLSVDEAARGAERRWGVGRRPRHCGGLVRLACAGLRRVGAGMGDPPRLGWQAGRAAAGAGDAGGDAVRAGSAFWAVRHAKGSVTRCDNLEEKCTKRTRA